MQEIFRLEQADHDGREEYEIRTTGIRPAAMRKLERARQYMPTDFFETPGMGNSLGMQTPKEAITRAR